jgi:hypothetical protein
MIFPLLDPPELARYCFPAAGCAEVSGELIVYRLSIPLQYKHGLGEYVSQEKAVERMKSVVFFDL